MIRKPVPLLSRVSVAVLTVLLVQPWLTLPARSTGEETLSADAAQCADILGVRQEAEQIVSLRRNGSTGPQSTGLRAHVLRKILQGTLQVQAAENHLESEQAYTYDVMERERRKIATVNQLFNIANFLQFGVLYTIEPYSRINHKFIQSAICTTTGGGIGLTLPVLNILYNKTAKASNLTPPSYFAHVVTGKPVDSSNLPPYITQYLDSPAPGSQVSRKEALNRIWNQRYHADMSKKETLCGIDDGKKKSMFVLNSRIVLLWSLYTTIQGFDNELLALLDQICNYQAEQTVLPKPTVPAAAELGPKGDEAERLLHLESVVAELRSMNGSNAASARKEELEIALMEKIVAGYLDMRIGADKCQEQLNYQYDVVLAQMMARRGKFLQKTYEVNFLQTNILGTTAGYNYLRGNGKVGNELFAIANSIGILITTVSLMATQGGWRRNDTGPNSLADFFDLRANEQHGFSPLIWNFLNDSSDSTGGKTRREYLQEVWKKDAVTNIDLKDRKNQEKLGSMPSCKSDTIKLVINRIALLSALQEQLRHFDVELLELLRKTWTETTPAMTETLVSGQMATNADTPGSAAAKLLGIESLVAQASNAGENQPAKILLTRDVLEGFLEASVDADMLGRQITLETQVMNRMIRQRDNAIQMTNILNFYQIGILGVISDALGLSSNSRTVLAGNDINIVSGYLVVTLAILALLERHGGLRPTTAEPNLLGSFFGMKSERVRLSPFTVQYLDTVAPNSPSGLTRRLELLKYWEEAKVLNVNVKNKSTDEKLAAEGRRHHWWNETINLINNRVFMLYDLRAVVRTSNVGFNEVLSAVQ